MERGAKSLTLHSNAIIAAFDAGGRLCRPFVVGASSLLGLPCTPATHLISMAAPIFTVQDINMAMLPNNALKRRLP